MRCTRFKECVEQVHWEEIPVKRKKGKKNQKDKRKTERRLSQPPCQDSEHQKVCIECVDKRPRVSCPELGKTYLLDQSDEAVKKELLKVRVDGGVISPPESLKLYKCDYMILVRSDTGLPEEVVLVELKGKNMKHACEQLESTLKLPEFSEVLRTAKHIHGRIVLSGVPRNKYANDAYIELKKVFRKLGGDLEKGEKELTDIYQAMKRTDRL